MALTVFTAPLLWHAFFAIFGFDFAFYFDLDGRLVVFVKRRQRLLSVSQFQSEPVDRRSKAKLTCVAPPADTDTNTRSADTDTTSASQESEFATRSEVVHGIRFRKNYHCKREIQLAAGSVKCLTKKIKKE